MRIELSRNAPQGFKDLAWDIFFKSRHRGISFEVHFPFVNSDKGFYVRSTMRDEIIGGMAVIPVMRHEPRFVAGLVGLVCVHPAHRMVGHATAMLQAAIGHARELQMDDLILWTGKPRVYQKLGFEACDTGVFGSVAARVPPTESQANVVRSVWPNDDDPRGLPPFALKAHQWTSPSASIIVLEDATGPILAEWSGLDEDVLSIIHHTMPAKWRINAHEGDRLLSLLDRGSWEIDLQPTNLQMIMNLRKHAEVDPYKLRILDRV